MKLRSVLAIALLSLALVISADDRLIECVGCWMPVDNSPTVEESLGVNIHFTDPKPGELKMIADAGFRWVRMDFKWDTTETERGRYDFSAYERLLKELETNHLRAMFILDYSNPLYGDGAPRTETARDAFAKWAVAVAQHFSNRSVLWEIYNEPNNPTFWKPVNAKEYALLANAVGQAFQESVPGEKLIGPAVGEMDFGFIDACFKAGAIDSFSAVSVHPYLRTDPELVANDYSRLRLMIDRYATRSNEDKPNIMSGEWGYSSIWRGMTEEKQAAMLAREFLTNLANGIEISIWYDWRDDGTDPKDPEHHFGLVRNQYQAGRQPGYQPKPAYLAAKTLTNILGGFRFQERLDAGGPEDYVLAFERGDERRFVAWTTAPTPHRLNIPGLPGQYALITMSGAEGSRTLATRDALSMEVSTAPVYLVSAN
jgi:hypothetical protein